MCRPLLDELLEFPRLLLESLRQPLEDGTVTVSRAHSSLHFPARVMLIGALNPCPCGFMTDPERACVCTPLQINKYRKRLSGPLLDRIDLFVEVPKVKLHELADGADAESSALIRARTQQARARQIERYSDLGFSSNSELGSQHIRGRLHLSRDAATILHHAAQQYRLSARAYFRTIKVAQTIADLSATSEIATEHVAEALQYRQHDE